MEDPETQPRDHVQHSEKTDQVDQETCRICRGESTEEEPLFHPCKCSGSIKYVHQDCLDEWLKHSKKPPVCELCNTPYRFTKVYSTNMPSQLPVLVFIRKFALDVAKTSVFALRCGLVASLWLICLPLTASYACYLYTMVAESVPYNLSILKHPVESVTTSFKEPRTSAIISLHGIIDSQISSQLTKNFILDILEGQVIILFLFLLFFIIMLVREWILQNDLFVNQMREIGRQGLMRAAAGELPRGRGRLGGDGATARRLDGAGGGRDQPEDLRRLVVGDEEAVNRLLQRQALRRLEQEVLARQRDANRGDNQNENGGPHDGDHDQSDDDEDPDWIDDGSENDSDQENDDIDGIMDNNPVHHLEDEPLAPPRNDFAFAEAANQNHDEVARDAPAAPPQRPMQNVNVDQFDFGDFDEQANMDDADGGILEFAGIRGPLLTLLGTYSAANVAAVTISGLLYFVPYCAGRLIVFAFLNKPADWAKYLLQILFYFGNETFYQCAKLISEVIPINMQVLEQEAVERHAVGLVFTPLEANLPGTGFWNRVVCTLIGHSLVLMAVGLYAGSTRRFSKGLRSWSHEIAVLQYIAQAQAILKVITIIGIELVVFPIFCGVLLVDIALDPLYPQATLHDRVLFTMHHPITSTFTHWAVGTCYMFLFAMFVSLCRKIMRPGVLYFVRDPNDPNFHPVRDVLERHLVSQLGKIAISAVIYSILIVGCIGGVVAGLRYGLNVGYLPLHLTPILNEDQLFTIAPMIASYNLLLPILVKIIRSLNIMRKVWDSVLHYSCSLLRLSSFILNKPVPQEQGYVYFGSWWAKLRFAHPDYSQPTTLEKAKLGDSNAAYFIRDGRFVRAPNSDSIKSDVKLKMFVTVTKDDERLDGKTDDGEQELKQYTIVYRPPWFKLRIVVLLLIIWAAGIAVVFTVSALPLIIGKSLVKALVPKEMLGDLVYYLVGIVPVAFGIYFADNWAKVSDFLSRELFQATTLERQRLVQKFVRASAVVGKLVFSVLAVLMIIPLMLGTMVDLYIAIPATTYIYPETSFDMSLNGTLLHGLAVMVLAKDVIMSRFPESVPARRYRAMTRGGWNNYDIKIAFKSFVLPVTLFAIIGALLPMSLGYVATHTLYSTSNDMTKNLIHKFAYPAVLITGLLFMLAAAIVSAWRRWETAVRDEAYMVGRQLQNM